jgi:non-ribosomal peptide synthetase component F
MRVITCGGDKCHKGPRPDAKFRFFSIYGPCECTIAMTCFELLPSTVAPPFILGPPESNVQVYILDGNMQLLPIGVIGELYIGGVQLARGYYRRPDATKASFVPNPFSSDPTSRLYKTGDLGRYLRDGTLEFFGRKDGQVKIRGNRIELGEIEAALLDHPALKEVCVIARQDPVPGSTAVPEKRLVAYYVKKDAKSTHPFYPKHVLLVFPWRLT